MVFVMLRLTDRGRAPFPRVPWQSLGTRRKLLQLSILSLFTLCAMRYALCGQAYSTVIVGRIVPALAGLIRQNKELRIKSGEPA